MNAPESTFIADEAGASRASLAGRLTLLAGQMLKLAGELSRPGAAHGRHEAAPAEGDAESVLLGLLADEVYRDRRRRARHLPSRLLGEPAWDILLALFVIGSKGRDVSVSDACRAADAPASTALRWLHHLEVEGLVERLSDESDARRFYVRLTREGMAQMTAYFAACRVELIGEVVRQPRAVQSTLWADVA